MSSKDRRRAIRHAARDLKLIGQPFNDEKISLPSGSNYPPFECFATDISSSSLVRAFRLDVRVGDKMVVKVKKLDVVGAVVQPICFTTRLKRDLQSAKIEVLTPLSALSRRLNMGELLEAVVSSTDPLQIELLEAPPLATKDLPTYFRTGTCPDLESFAKFIKNRVEKDNTFLDAALELPTCSKQSFLGFKEIDMDLKETASVIRKAQDEDLAMDTVQRGVEEMRNGNLSGAMQQFNKALELNAECVDALVARGAAFSNEAVYEKAEVDLEKALQLMPSHVNAKTYLAETFIKHAALLEVQGEQSKAKSIYERALKLKEDRRARQALEKMEQRKRPIEVVDLESEHKNKKKKPAEDEATIRRRRAQERKKLKEMEDFITALKKAK